MCGSVCACMSGVWVRVSQSLCLVSSVWPASQCPCIPQPLVQMSDDWPPRNWPPRTRPTPFTRSSDWIHSSHCRSDAQWVCPCRPATTWTCGYITTMSMPRIKAKRLSNATDWDRLWPYWESRLHWCKHRREEEWSGIILRRKDKQGGYIYIYVCERAVGGWTK